MRRNAGRDEDDGVEVERLLGSSGRREVAVVNGIERAAEHTQRHERFLACCFFCGLLVPPARRGGTSAGL